MKRILFALFFVSVAILGGYFFGTQASNYFKPIHYSDLDVISNANEKMLMDTSKIAVIGSSLPNYYFYDIDGSQIQLSNLIKSKCLLVFITSDCEACRMQLEEIKKASAISSVQQGIVLVTHSNPFEILALRKEFGLKNRILYDHWNSYASHLKLSSIPFSIELDSGLIIKDLFPRRLSEKDLKEVLKD